MFELDLEHECVFSPLNTCVGAGRMIVVHVGSHDRVPEMIITVSGLLRIFYQGNISHLFPYIIDQNH